ncbi:uncharacterized protein LOC115389900 isoform X3 [Salarias fasciatus]|uniref:Ribonuclease inhibitor-like n=1 Tax=Salarias fasciatus TaxID=181472 RepID=A0A672FBC6_SALFA|nr:uncharacterized protein LOC115389900 isoform X3 [Salarias fasciatus]
MSDGDSEKKGGSSSAAPPISKTRSCKEQSSQADDLKPGPRNISVNLSETESEELERFCAELESPQQTVEILRLIDGSLSKRCCLALTSALEAKPSSLRELHLNGVKFHNGDQLKLLCDALGRQHCRIRTLRLVDCDLRWDSCVYLSSAIMSNPSHLKELDLSVNQLEDVGMKHLCRGLMKKNCMLERLKLTSCHLSGKGCTYLKPLLMSKHCHLQNLDLSCNSLKDDGIKELSVGLSSPNCRLSSLSLTHCEVSDEGWASLVKALKKRSVPLDELDLQGNDLSFDGMKSLNEYKMGLGIGEGLSKNPVVRYQGSYMGVEPTIQTLRRPSRWSEIPIVLQYQGPINKPPSDKSHLTLASSRGNTQDEKTEVNVHISGHDQWSPPFPIQFQGPSKFQSEKFDEHGRISYRPSRWSEIPIVPQNQGPINKPPSDKSHLTLASSRGNTQDEKTEVNMLQGPSKFQSDKFDEHGRISYRHIVQIKIPTKLHFRGPINKPPSDKSHLTLASSRGNTQDEKTEVNMLQGPSKFQSDKFDEHGRISYRFTGLGPGVFLCQLTGLGFTMTRQGELLFRIIQWDEELLQAAGKVPAGPLFKIEGTTNAVSQLHLLHCEPNPACSNGLSVAHMVEEGMNILEPLKINDTHVVVDVSHFSAFGLVINFFRDIIKRPIRSQVLLFHHPTWTEDLQKVNVFLLPKNIPLEEAKSQQRNAEYIDATSLCELIENHCYTLACPESTLVQPKNSKFYSSFETVDHPNFEIHLKRTTKGGTVVVKGQDGTTAWEYYMTLTGSGGTSASSSTSQSAQPPANDPSLAPLRADVSGPDSTTRDLQTSKKKLLSFRNGFIESISMSNLHQLMDELLQTCVINDREYQDLRDVAPTSRAATALIDMVRNKGGEALKKMMEALSQIDPHLYSHLNS